MFGRKRKPADFKVEIETHIALEAERLRGQGMSEEEARAAARRAFGNTTAAEERFYESGRWLGWDRFRADIRYGLRMLAKSPGSSAVALLTIALGIGANTAIFTVFDAVLLRALPVEQPGRLVLLTDPNSHGGWYGHEGGTRDLVGYGEFEYLRDHNAVFAGIFAADSEAPALPVRIASEQPQSGGNAETARVQMVSGDFFSTLGIQAMRGRMFDSEVDRGRGTAPVAVMSYPFWVHRFGSDDSVLGKTVEIRRTSFTVIGVAPPGFFGATLGEAPDLWVPLTMQAVVYPGRDMLSPVPAMQNEYIWLQSMARLKPEVTLEQAQANVAVLFRRTLETQIGPGLSAKERQHYLDQNVQLRPGGRGAAIVRHAMGQPLQILLALVGLVLLVACANVANLLLARGSARQREYAIRSALGAGRSRLVRQLLVESSLLALLGTVVGVLLAWWASGLLIREMPGLLTGSGAIHLDLATDWRVAAFTFFVTVLTALLFGLAPAWRAAHVDVLPALKAATAGPAGGVASRRPSAGKLLVVGQVAASLVLLVTAGLFIRSLTRLGEVSLGYQPERLILFRVDAASAGYQGEAQTTFCRRLLDRLTSIPGVSAATVSTNGLFEGSDSGDPITVEGYTPPGGEGLNSRIDHVGPGYFSTVGIPILLGRGIEPGDAAPSERVGVINQAFARAYFPHTNPLGKTVRDIFPGNPGALVVVGVAGNARSNSLRDTLRPRVYIPLFNPLWPHSYLSFELRARADSAALGGAIRQAVGETNEGLLPVEIETLPGLIDRSLGPEHFIAALSGAFAFLAALLAAVGLYGIMASTIARRTREIGIRVALGATPGEILAQVLREALLLVAIGVAIGAPLAIAGARLLGGLLFGLGLIDPAVLAAAALLLAGAGTLAAIVPALRARRTDPVAAMRFD